MNLEDYWKKRGADYYLEQKNNPKHIKDRLQAQEKQVLELIKNMQFKKILELGCGYGRFSRIIYDKFKPDTYTAIDISQDQIENAKNYVENRKIDFQCSEIQNLDLKKEYDLVFSSEVMMHINFVDIDKIIKKMISFAKEKIITIDWFNPEKIGTESGGYCFMHDYSSLFLKNGAKSVKIHMLPLPFSLKMLSIYSKLKNKPPAETQAIFEVDIL